MDMLQAMRTVAAISHHGSFAQAARSMGMSAPSVSRIVADLEDDLGVRIFNRSTRQLALTEEGETYLRRSQIILEEIDALRAAARATHRKPGGRLTISSAVAFGNERLAPLLPEFRQRFPDVSIDFKVGSRSVDLIEEHVDVALRVGPGQLPDSALTSVRLCRFRMVFVASPDHIEAFGMPERLEDLGARPFVKLATGTWGHVQRLSTPKGEVEFRLPDEFSVDSHRAQIWAALNGKDCTLMHDYVAAPELAAGRLVHVLPEYQTVDQDVYAVFVHRTLMPARIRVFIDFLKGALA